MHRLFKIRPRGVLGRRRLLVGLSTLVLLIVLAVIVTMWARSGPDDAGDLTAEVTGTTVVLNGVVGSESLATVEDVLADHPDVTTLEFGLMYGSVDDDTNLEIARLVRARGLDTHLVSGSRAYSGATDLFLAGTERTIDCGAAFGVHSWAKADGRTARDFPRDPEHPEHAQYIEYYEELGGIRAEEFYWFTVDRSPFERIYHMSPEEINGFGIVTTPMSCPAPST